MARRGSSFSYLLFLVVVAVVGYYVLQQIKVSQPSRRQPRENAPALTERTYPDLRGERRHGPERPASCETLGIICRSAYFASWQEPADGNCRTLMRNGYPMPDPRCTPGGVDPTVTGDVLRDPAWRTRCLRDCAESEAEKHAAYGWYEVEKPRRNSGENQVCELDHLVPLELGGADGMGNIWPECGPDGVALNERYFKIKDRVENYLADEVKTGRMPLSEAQKGIATDWTQYLDQANQYCAKGGRC